MYLFLLAGDAKFDDDSEDKIPLFRHHDEINQEYLVQGSQVYALPTGMPAVLRNLFVAFVRVCSVNA